MSKDVVDVLDEEQGEDDTTESEDGDSITPDITSSDESGGIIEPAAEAGDVKAMYDKFSKMKTDMIGSEDRVEISGSMFITKSGWRKIATAFNVSVEIVDRETWTEELGDNVEVFNAQIKAKATAPNGKEVTSVGVCSSNESNFLRPLKVDSNADIEEAGKKASKYVPSNRLSPDMLVHVDNRWRMIKPVSEVNVHNIVATAATRAKNRAISDLVGGGEVSAEELTKEDFL